MQRSSLIDHDKQLNRIRSIKENVSTRWRERQEAEAEKQQHPRHHRRSPTIPQRGARTKQQTATAGTSSVRGAGKQRLAAHFGSGPGHGARAASSIDGPGPLQRREPAAALPRRHLRFSRRTGKRIAKNRKESRIPHFPHPNLHCRRNYRPPPPPLPTRAGKEGILTPAVRVAAQE